MELLGFLHGVKKGFQDVEKRARDPRGIRHDP
ncbi:hypothetical protein FrEUN1fDRAFT_1579 [Parafrankia sp. EUN1f]|nr:hypothetical protein FrEUN1fDRAFT_1579 [Parafrankia sp. EUN1f]